MGLYSKLIPFSRNIDIYGFMKKKQFFQNDLKKRAFPRNRRRFPRNVAIIKDRGKKQLLNVISKKRPFAGMYAQNLDICSKNYFSKVISK